jgi:iron(III) transport system ATP-binding protein
MTVSGESASAVEPADLVAADLHKAFGPHPVLTGINLNVPAGTFAAVLGPSGSGKTTLLRILAGFERPDRGTVTIGTVIVDDDQRHVAPESRHIGYVSQEGSLFPHLDVQANVGFGLPRRQRKAARVNDLLDAVGLSGFARRYPHQLSGGQQQRVALARALAVEPRIVLLDEPFASLDSHLRASVRSDVHAILRQAGATAILVTHDQDEALSIADLVAVIRRGTIAQSATPEVLYAHPVDADLAHFVGEANLVDGVARGDVVETSFGSLAFESPQRVRSGQRMTVLIRPEQMAVDVSPDDAGVPGRVLSTGFHGHDAVVTVSLIADGGRSPIIARVLGGHRLGPDSGVTISVRGPVIAWPEVSEVGVRETALSSVPRP